MNRELSFFLSFYFHTSDGRAKWGHSSDRGRAWCPTYRTDFGSVFFLLYFYPLFYSTWFCNPYPFRPPKKLKNPYSRNSLGNQSDLCLYNPMATAIQSAEVASRFRWWRALQRHTQNTVAFSLSSRHRTHTLLCNQAPLSDCNCHWYDH